MTKRILIVEDDHLQSELLKKMLHNELGYIIEQAYDATNASNFLKEHHAQIDLIILDLCLPDIHGLELLSTFRHKFPRIPAIILSGSENVNDANVAMRKGALDFISKPPQIDRIRVSIENALKITSLTKEVSDLNKHQKKDIKTFSSLSENGEGLNEIIQKAKKASTSDIPIMLIGETGVGKEVFAQAIHAQSHRKNRPFLAVNCGAIPKQLVESVLFGHEKGSFTGAIEKTIGKFREAEGGTLFLDEVGELPIETQVKLLRALQQNEVEPVGSATSVPVNVRVISATNRNLSQGIQNGNFREDLFFRLEGLPITIPSLRERQKDIPILAQYFLKEFIQKESFNKKTLTAEALAFLSRQPWPGNVRELQNTIHRALILTHGSEINVSDLSSSLNSDIFKKIENPEPQTNAKGSKRVEIISSNGCVKALDEIEMDAVKIIVNHFKGNITKSSQALGVAKSTFYRKWKTLTHKSLRG